MLNEEGNSIRLEMTHVHTVKAIISKPLWRCWSTAVISSVFHIPHLIHLRMPLKEDNGVRATNQPRLHRNLDLRQTIWHRGVNMFCPMLNASACRTCEWANFTTFKRFRRCDLGCFSFFFWRVLCERKEKKKQKKQNHSSSSNALCGLELYMQKCECFALSTCPDTLLQLHHCAVTHAATEISSHYLPLFTLRPDDSSRPKTLREW